MGSSQDRELSYGLLGHVEYNREASEWVFQTSPDVESILHPVGPLRSACKGSMASDTCDAVRSRHERDKAVRQLIDCDATLAPAGPYLESFLQVSQAVSDAAAAEKQFPADLISFGNSVRYLDSTLKSYKSIEIVAFATGHLGDVARISLLQKDGLHLSGLFTDEFQDTDHADVFSAHWREAASCSLQQVQFSEIKDELSAWLALRSASGTSLLRPAVRSDPIFQSTISDEEGFSSYVSSQLSYMDASLFGKISLKRTGGNSHSHVSFNPWHYNQLGILCANGNWYVFELLESTTVHDFGETSRKDIVLVASGCETSFINQQWSKMLWVDGANTIALACRNTASIYISDEEPMKHSIPGLNLDSNELLVDLQRCPTNLSLIYILTSRRLFWYRVQSTKTANSIPAEKPVCSLIFSWLHHLSPDDMTLRAIVMDVPADYDASFNKSSNHLHTYVVLLHSVQSDLIVYTTFEYDLGRQYGYRRSNPSILSTKSISTSTEYGPAYTRTLVLRKLDLYNWPNFASEAAESPPTFSLIRFLDNLEIREQVYILASPSEINERLTKTVQECLQAGQRVEKFTLDEGFIVPEGILAQDDWADSQAITGTLCSPHSSTNDTDFQWLGEHLFKLVLEENSMSIPSGSFEDAIEKVLESRGELGIGIHTMAEFLSTSLPIDEIDKFSATIQDILGAISGEQRVRLVEEDNPSLRSARLLSPIQSRYMLRLPDCDEVASLVPLYERLLATWIRPLRDEIPGKARVILERICRRVAMRIYLSSHGVMAATVAGAGDQPSGEDNLDLTLTIRQKPVAADTAPSSIPVSVARHSSRKFSESRSMSTQENMSQQQLTSSQKHDDRASLNESDVFAALRSVATFKEPLLNESMRGHSSNWKIGEDPAKFDWSLVRQVRSLEAQAPPARDKRPQRVESVQRSKAPDLLSSVDTESAGFKSSQQPQSSQSLAYESSQVIEPTESSACDIPSAAMSSQKSISSKRSKVKRRPGF